MCEVNIPKTNGALLAHWGQVIQKLEIGNCQKLAPMKKT